MSTSEAIRKNTEALYDRGAVSVPGFAPLTLEQLRAQCGVYSEVAEIDTYLQSLLPAAINTVEHLTGTVLCACSREAVASGFAPCLGLPRNPLLSVAAFSYYDTQNNLVTLDAADWFVSRGAVHSFIRFTDDFEFPDTFARHDAVQVSYRAGYETAEEIPAALRHALLLLTAHWFNNREAASDNQQYEVPFAVSALTGPYREWGV